MVTQEICEGFAVETEVGLIFTVKGLLHPPDRLFAYLRYLPDPEGDRRRDGISYRRIYHFEEQRRLLKTLCPACLWRDPVLGIEVQGVDRRAVRTVYDPRRYLDSLLKEGPAGEVESDALELAQLVQAAAGVAWENLGISGSLLLGLHKPGSDVDLLVYGDAPGRAVHRALGDLMQDPANPIRRLDQEELAALHAAHFPDTPLPLADMVRLQKRKVNEGVLRGRPFFVRFVKLPGEAGERYGDRRFERVGTVTIRARVTDARDAIFTPCRYAVSQVRFLEGQQVGDLCELVSFRGRFSGQVLAGEEAVAKGGLERVTCSDGAWSHRLVIGGQRGDYLCVPGLATLNIDNGSGAGYLAHLINQ